MTIQRIIQEAINKNPRDLKEALTEELRGRIRLALEAKMSDDEDEEDEDDDEEDMKEEAEELDELSKDTVRNYYNKAGEQGRDITGKMMVGGGDWSKDGKDTETLKKRAAGRAMALKRRSGEVKMSEEAEELDELKKSTLASYVSKAADNAASNAIKYGEKKAQSDEMDRMMNRHMSYDDKDKMRSIMKTTNKDVNAPREKAAKRLAGVDLAIKKLTRD
jgi:hypothetical protein